MEFCILPPRDKLKYARLSRVHLCLAHVDNDRYWEFYKERKQDGDFIILDNGAYEGSYDWNILRNRAIDLKPDVVTLPDYIGYTWDVTYNAAKHFLDDNIHNLPDNTEWMYVPQSVRGDILGWCKGLENALEDKRITWIGLPRALAYFYTDDLFIRSRIATHLKFRRNDISIHALGMVKGSVDELKSLSSTFCVESIDSHWPFKGPIEEVKSRLEACGVHTSVSVG